MVGARELRPIKWRVTHAVVEYVRSRAIKHTSLENGVGTKLHVYERAHYNCTEDIHYCTYTYACMDYVHA